MPAIPILHAGQAVLRVTTVDTRVLALASVVFVVAAASIWLPARTFRTLRPWQPRGAFFRGAVAALVFLAVLPSVLPYDHLLPAAAHADSAADDESVHASHCHVSPGTCSDAPVTSGPGQLLMGNPLLAVPAMLSILLLLSVPALAGITPRPQVRPPLAASFA